MKATGFVRHSRGIGLVEVMMAVAISGGLALTIAKLMENSNQSAKQIEAKTENTNLKGIIQDVLNNTTACTFTFGLVMTPANVATLTSGAPTASIAVPNIKDKTGAIKYSTASTDIRPLSITSLKVTNYNSGTQTGDLIVNSTFKKSSSMVMEVKPIKIPINFSFTSGNLTACSTMAVGGEWLLGGNAGTVDGTDYIGTSDNTPLNFRINAQNSGRIDAGGSTFLGYKSGELNATYSNTGFGAKALSKIVSNSWSTAVGYRALELATGNANTAVGSTAMIANTTGMQNAAFGTFALRSNTTGNNNTALGPSALDRNVSGNGNTAVGFSALSKSLGGESVAVGYAALFNNTGSSNTAIGSSALFASTTGTLNTAVGKAAGTANVNGSENTFIGHGAGFELTTGSNNLFLGSFSGGGIGLTSSNSKLIIETNFGNPNGLIEGDFSAGGRYVEINGVLNLKGRSGVAMALENNQQIVTSTNSVADKVYFDSRAIFRDATGGGSGFVGLSGGLGVGSGSWSDGSVVPVQGNMMVEGKIGIGTKTPSEKLHVFGGRGIIDVTGTGTRTVFTIANSNGANTRFGFQSTNDSFIGYQNNLRIGASPSDAGLSSTAMYFSPAGKIGIGLDNPTYQLQLSTDSAAKPGTAAWAIASDVRLKDVRAPFLRGLDALDGIHPIYFRYKEGNELGLPTDKEYVGIIAQDAKRSVPESVQTDDKGYLHLTNDSILWTMFNGIKELHVKFLKLFTSDERQNQEIKLLKAENAKLSLQMKKQQESFEIRIKKLEARK